MTEEADNWQSMNTAPRDGTVILGAINWRGNRPTFSVEAIRWKQHKTKNAKTTGWWGAEGGRFDLDEVIAWQPVPTITERLKRPQRKW